MSEVTQRGGSHQFTVKASELGMFLTGGLVSCGCEEYARHVDI